MKINQINIYKVKLYGIKEYEEKRLVGDWF